MVTTAVFFGDVQRITYSPSIVLLPRGLGEGESQVTRATNPEPSPIAIQPSASALTADGLFH